MCKNDAERLVTRVAEELIGCATRKLCCHVSRAVESENRYLSTDKFELLHLKTSAQRQVSVLFVTLVES